MTREGLSTAEIIKHRLLALGERHAVNDGVAIGWIAQPE